MADWVVLMPGGLTPPTIQRRGRRLQRPAIDSAVHVPLPEDRAHRRSLDLHHGRDRRHRAQHRLRHGLPRLAAVPRPDHPAAGDSAAWLEWIHRFWGVVIGFVMLGLVIEAWISQRRTRSLVVGSVAAFLLTGFQAYLGAVTVAQNNSGESVTAHLATAMVLLGVTIFLAVRAGYPVILPTHGSSQRLTLLIGFTALSVYALLLFGSHVTATSSALVFPDWPLFGGQILPTFSADPAVASLQLAHFLHRFVSLVVGIFLAITTVVVWRAARIDPDTRSAR